MDALVTLRTHRAVPQRKLVTSHETTPSVFLTNTTNGKSHGDVTLEMSCDLLCEQLNPSQLVQGGLQSGLFLTPGPSALSSWT